MFTRLCVRDAKPQYLVHIPRVRRLLEAALAHPDPALADAVAWFAAHVPADARRSPPFPSV